MKTTLFILLLLLAAGCQSPHPTDSSWKELEKMEQASAKPTPVTASPEPAQDWIDWDHEPAPQGGADVPLDEYREKPILPPWLEVSVEIAYFWKVRD